MRSRFLLASILLAIASSGCDNESLTISAADGGTLGSDGLTNIIRIPLGESVDVKASIHRSEIEGSSEFAVTELTVDDPRLLAIEPAAGGFTLRALAPGETLLHAKARLGPLAADPTAECPIRIIAELAP